MKIKYILSTVFLSIALSLSAQDKTYEEYVNEALTYTEARDFRSAERAYKAALKKDPTNATNVMLYMNLGTVQRDLGKYEEALVAYNLIAEKYPTLKYVLDSRAKLYCDMKEYDKALLDYNALLLNDPDNIDILYNRGLVLLSLQKYDEAKIDFDRILSLDKNNIQANIGVAVVLTRKKDWKTAEKLYSDLIADNKKNGILYANRAEVYLYLKRLRSMDDDINKALELGYDDPSIYVLRGQLQLERYNNEAALKDFEKAKELGVDSVIVNSFLQLCNNKKAKNKD